MSSECWLGYVDSWRQRRVEAGVFCWLARPSELIMQCAVASASHHAQHPVKHAQYVCVVDFCSLNTDLSVSPKRVRSKTRCAELCSRRNSAFGFHVGICGCKGVR